MKALILFFLIISVHHLMGQTPSESSRKIKTIITVSNKKDKSIFYQKDSKGNQIFVKNDGMNGPITMISASIYDSLNRETKSYFVHSNLGFYIKEISYSKDQIKYYSHENDSITSEFYSRKLLNKIKTKSEFLKSEGIQLLLKENKYLSMIKKLDLSNNVVEEIHLSKEGDTSSIFFYQYDNKNNQTYFRYFTPKSKIWNWEIFSVYDDSSNMIKSFRIVNDTKDTSEVYNYIYNSKNQLVSEDYYSYNKFGNRTDYYYNQKKQVTEKLFYEREENDLDHKTKFKYNKSGNVIEEIRVEYRNKKKTSIEKLKTKYTFWK